MQLRQEFGHCRQDLDIAGRNWEAIATDGRQQVLLMFFVKELLYIDNSSVCVHYCRRAELSILR